MSIYIRLDIEVLRARVFDRKKVLLRKGGVPDLLSNRFIVYVLTFLSSLTGLSCRNLVRVRLR